MLTYRKNYKHWRLSHFFLLVFTNQNTYIQKKINSNFIVSNDTKDVLGFEWMSMTLLKLLLGANNQYVSKFIE